MAFTDLTDLFLECSCALGRNTADENASDQPVHQAISYLRVPSAVVDWGSDHRGRQAEAVSAFGVGVAWLGRLRVQVGRLWRRDRPGWQEPYLLEEQAAHG
jgi:hypothetical protein